jgi:hypothetical protein
VDRLRRDEHTDYVPTIRPGRRYAQEVHAPLGELSRLSDELVHGLACTPAEQISAETAALTPDSIRQCAADMLRTAVVQVPNATDPPAWSLLRYAAPDQTSLVGAHAVRRRKYRNVERWSSGEELAYSESVVGLRQGHVAAQAVPTSTVMLAYGRLRSLIDLVVGSCSCVRRRRTRDRLDRLARPGRAAGYRIARVR